MTAEEIQSFQGALLALAGAFDTYKRVTGYEAVLVGGAAVAIFTSGAHGSGDLDFVAANDAVVARCMAEAGFVPETRPGYLRFGWCHPEHPLFGFQQVSGPLFDGRADRSRMFRVEMRAGLELVLPSIEDMIADRLGQHAIAGRTDTSRLDQAVTMFRIARGLDRAYLEKRIVEEGGDPTLLSASDESGKPEKGHKA